MRRRDLLRLAAMVPANAVAQTCADKPALAIFTLWDLSGSAAAAPIRTRYLESFRSILGAFYDPAFPRREPPFPHETLIRGDVISSGSLATSSFPLNVCLPGYGGAFSSSPTLYRNALRKAWESASEQAKKLAADQRNFPTTDLLGAMHLAQTALRGEATASARHRYLVLFSDMVESSPRYDFTREKFTAARIRAVLDTERRRGLPDLQGVKVWVAGGGAELKGGLTSEQVLGLRNFWIEYFRATGADLSAERFAGSLLNFQLPAGP